MGLEDFGNLSNCDILVPPPRGTKDAESNHMTKIGKVLSERVGIPLHEFLHKSEEYDSQRSLTGAQERWVNVEGNIECIRDFRTSPFAVVIDDIVTTGATLENCARALKEAGASKVVGLAIARTEYIDDPVDAEVYIPEDEIPEDERP